MRTGTRRCVGCGTELARGQEFCLECGVAQDSPAGPQWRRPLVAAAVTLVFALLLLAFAYMRMSDEADDAAASHAAGAKVVRQAAASGPGGGSDSRKPVRPAHLAAGSNP
jgi:hypothetical protein